MALDDFGRVIYIPVGHSVFVFPTPPLTDEQDE
jgi:hypothetical protein